MNRDKNNIVTFNNTNGIDIGKTKCFHTLYQIILFGQFYKKLKIDFKTEDVFLNEHSLPRAGIIRFGV